LLVPVLVFVHAFISILSSAGEVVFVAAFVGVADVFLPSVVVVGSGIR
jgi:hypothetical protein